MLFWYAGYERFQFRKEIPAQTQHLPGIRVKWVGPFTTSPTQRFGSVPTPKYAPSGFTSNSKTFGSGSFGFHFKIFSNFWSETFHNFPAFQYWYGTIINNVWFLPSVICIFMKFFIFYIKKIRSVMAKNLDPLSHFRFWKITSDSLKALQAKKHRFIYDYFIPIAQLMLKNCILQTETLLTISSLEKTWSVGQRVSEE